MRKPKKKEREWKSIKVPEETYKELQKWGKGIGKAVEILVEEQKEAFEKKLGDVGDVAGDLASVLFESGIFDIKFKRTGIESIKEIGDVLQIRWRTDVQIPSSDAREQIINIISPKEEEKEVEEGED